MIDMQQICAFLHFGFLPRVSSDVLDEPWANLLGPQQDAEQATTEEYSSLVKRGECILRSLFETPAGNHHIVPLSGGLDSRAILGGLLTAGLKEQITTITFGTPGTYDLEIGRYVARRMGLRNELIDLTQVPLKQQFLQETVSEGAAWTWLFDGFYQRQIAKRFGKEVTFWSGYMGEALTGKDLRPQESETWAEAKEHFATDTCFVSAIKLTPPSFRPTDALPKSPLLINDNLCYDDQLNFAFLQHCWFKRAVMPDGYDYQTPFRHPQWVRFILGVPRPYRVKQSLYKDILKAAYPKLFSLPTKTNLGLPLQAASWRYQLRRARVGGGLLARRFLPFYSRRVTPLINYIDFDEGLRNRLDLKTIVYENLQDLERRGIVDWIDIQKIWDRHQRRWANHGDALTLLASLEINLKAMCNAI